GVIIMGLGFLFMAGAAHQYVPGGEKSAMYWLALAYLLHTIGELCSSPVSLSFITKLAPVKYASLMMGVYFAATGLGNKVAGIVGEASQSEPINIELTASKAELQPFLNPADSILVKGQNFKLHALLYPEDGQIAAVDEDNNTSMISIIKFEKDARKAEIMQEFKDDNISKENPYHATFTFNKNEDVAGETSGSDLGYSGALIIDEIQTQSEFWTFISITIFTVIFGSVVIMLLKPLKRLTHGAEDNERELPQQEKYELADNEVD
ncbi:MAG: MFS transporter, partial [Gillisia sp.]